MENKKYFILNGKQKQGPYTLDNLKEIGIGRNTMVWYAGMEKWMTATELPELKEIVVLIPPKVSSKRTRMLIILIAIVLVGGGFVATRIFSNPKVVVMNQPSLSNQQLYNLYAPSVVLIQHRYMYRITVDEKRFFFDDYYSYDESTGYLKGLTNDSMQAAEHAQPIQGTGFFTGSSGQILTNRHVARSAPTETEQQMIGHYFIRSLEGALASINFSDSVKRKKEENDSLLSALLDDSATNASLIADVKEKITEAEEYLAEDNDYDVLKTDAATVESIKNNTMLVEKVTLQLSVFPEGTSDINEYNGIPCVVVATSDDENVDLALLQTTIKRLPDTSLKKIDLSRISNIDFDEGLSPQMSERLILIGFNRGSDLAQTTEGIQSQLTDGKVSQNTDAYKLMYTIPTLPGSSGSPVFDEKGRLVSVNFADITQTQSFNYGIQPRQIKNFLKAHGMELN